MKISIGNDHTGVAYKEAIVKYLTEQGFEVINHGTDTPQSADYPDFAHRVGNDIDQDSVDFGIVICGSGNGIAMSVNKHSKVRCAVCWNKEIAELARLHNNANVISIPARFTALEQAIEMVKVFLKTSFEGGRHQRRVDKINQFC
ncbi:ribose 5-phosphate isomerase B [Capnocytophaga catalasegens]|uniref:Ribose 5-phosphate isomerase B n=1 Tax=Capnocytophaga catalasegens TaxID=1004260 RepID=A0AAV5AVE4_9FLAO|nr:ribose 5-phosphate isomerase B [Capnocytophaga catalasegens]GIZ16271.1 ribose 5-phosphate isomerase B [Capnocytophaga catalasegens]GJM49478.1 ribose 5-phosphate isomerase B [Capnocytophaga catalasegens]GJM52857.1 ribose 5-phosphate isomerase B [Capnocytophaga catalasegens]